MNLTKIDNSNVKFIDTVLKDLSNLIETGEKCWNKQLITGEHH